jgi:replicative DNA helicase
MIKKGLGVDTNILEQAIMTTLVSIGDDETKKPILQKAVLELIAEDFSAIADRDLFKLIEARVKQDKPYYSFELMADTSLEDVKSRIEYYITNNSYVIVSTLFDNISNLKKLNRIKSMQVNLNNILSGMKATQDADELEALVFNNLNALNQKSLGQQKQDNDFYSIASKLAQNETDVYFYPTTFKKLNEALCHRGIRQGSLIVVGGSSGVGKSSFSLFLLDAIASLQPDKQSLFFSLELDKIELWERYLSVLSKKVYSSMTQAEKEQAVIAGINKPNIRVFDLCDYPDIKSLQSIIRHATLASYNQLISVIVIDFIGLVKIENYKETKAQMLEDIAYQLLTLAKKLGCIIILLQQLNRDYNKDLKDVVPFAHQAADSSGPEKACSIWLGIGRHGEHNDGDPNHFEIACRKNRHGLKDFRISLEFFNGTFKELQPGFQFRRPVKKPQDYDF